MSSNSEVRVVEIKLEPHPNADSLSIVRIHGWQVVVRTDNWKDGDRAAYITPDSLVDPRRPEFDFLAPKDAPADKPVRIAVRKLRGIMSHGLLVPAPGATVGDDLAEALGVTRYEPDAGDGGDNTRPPRGYHPTYNVESWRRYGDLFVPGERVIVTEKINGESCRIFCDEDEVMHVGSRTAWKAKVSKSGDPIYWWKALTPEIESLCKVSGWTLYGELHGGVRGMKYGLQGGDLRFICFDAWDSADEHWIGYDALRDALGWRETFQIPYVPVLFDGPYDRDHMLALADGNTLVGGAAHIREGIVIHAVNERNDEKAGRAVLKIVSDAYLEKVK
jgi:RNA ligase (TIGR02306 family)